MGEDPDFGAGQTTVIPLPTAATKQAKKAKAEKKTKSKESQSRGKRFLPLEPRSCFRRRVQPEAEGMHDRFVGSAGSLSSRRHYLCGCDRP